jgi:hypothetical protein
MPLRDYVEKCCRAGDKITLHTLFACLIPKSTNTHSEYIITIDIPRQQWTHERASMLRYTFVACRVQICRTFEESVSLGIPPQPQYNNSLTMEALYKKEKSLNWTGF